MRNATPLLTPFLLCVLLPGMVPPVVAQTAPALLRYDHTDPIVLNEFAVASVRQGDPATAWILLERAALLAPHDERIVRNLLIIKAQRAGTLLAPVHPRSVAEPEPDRPGAMPVPPEPPPLWPGKQ